MRHAAGKVARPVPVIRVPCPGGPTDASLDALAVRQLADGATGVFASYGAHATCHGSRQMKFSGDYPGALVRSLESGGMKFAAFGAGAMGSQSPVGRGDDAERAEVIGTDLARLIRAACSATATRDVADSGPAGR